jgi:hypothetical protein
MILDINSKKNTFRHRTQAHLKRCSQLTSIYKISIYGDKDTGSEVMDFDMIFRDTSMADLHF